MDPDTIRSIVSQLDTTSAADEEAVWLQVRHLGAEVVPYLLEAFPSTRKWQGRVSLVFHSIRFARVSEAAFELGLLALEDRSFMVRWRGCGLLAYSLRRDALPALQAASTHKDSRTREDATAAMAAISESNHHLYVDRDRSGRTFWEVTPVDGSA